MRVVGSLIGARRGRLGLLAAFVLALTALALGERIGRCNDPRQGPRRLELERRDQLEKVAARRLPLRVRARRPRARPTTTRRTRRTGTAARPPVSSSAPTTSPARPAGASAGVDRERDRAGQPFPRGRRAPAGRAASGARPREDGQALAEPACSRGRSPGSTRSTPAPASSRSSTRRRSSGSKSSATRRQPPPPARGLWIAHWTSKSKPLVPAQNWNGQRLDVLAVDELRLGAGRSSTAPTATG